MSSITGAGIAGATMQLSELTEPPEPTEPPELVEPGDPLFDDRGPSSTPTVNWSQGPVRSTYIETDPTVWTEYRPILSPYGQWVVDGTYGEVWIPSVTIVGSNFVPYVTAGRWGYDTEYVWMSDFSWGWLPFHYGRWVYIAGRGWAWIPGRVYSGAWVVFRVGGAGFGYLGWAPMPPTWFWRGGIAYSLMVPPPAPYVFCPTRYFFTPRFDTHLVTGDRAPIIAGQTRPYVVAQPFVNPSERSMARPQANPQEASNGPPPSTFGIVAGSIYRPSPKDASLVRARSAARYSVASSFGGMEAHRSPPSVSPSSESEAGAVRPTRIDRALVPPPTVERLPPRFDRLPPMRVDRPGAPPTPIESPMPSMTPPQRIEPPRPTTYPVPPRVDTIPRIDPPRPDYRPIQPRIDSPPRFDPPRVPPHVQVDPLPPSYATPRAPSPPRAVDMPRVSPQFQVAPPPRMEAPRMQPPPRIDTPRVAPSLSNESMRRIQRTPMVIQRNR